MTDKRQKATKVKCKREESLTKQSIFVEYSLLQKKHLSFSGAHSQMNTTLYQNRPGETLNWTNLRLEPYHYLIYYVNIDLPHQYGIIFLSLSRRRSSSRTVPHRRWAGRNVCRSKATMYQVVIFSFKVLQIFIVYESAKDRNLRAFFSQVQNALSCNIFSK